MPRHGTWCDLAPAAATASSFEMKWPWDHHVLHHVLHSRDQVDGVSRLTGLNSSAESAEDVPCQWGVVLSTGVWIDGQSPACSVCHQQLESLRLSEGQVQCVSKLLRLDRCRFGFSSNFTAEPVPADAQSNKQPWSGVSRVLQDLAQNTRDHTLAHPPSMSGRWRTDPAAGSGSGTQPGGRRHQERGDDTGSSFRVDNYVQWTS